MTAGAALWISALSVLCADAGSIASRPSFAWTVPGGDEEIELPGVTDVQGIKVQMHMVLSKDKPESITRAFVDEFTRRGYFVAPGLHRTHEMQPVAVAIDRQGELAVSLVLLKSGDERTGVVTGQANVRPEARPGPGVPLVADARRVLTVPYEWGRLTLCDTSMGRLDVFKFYREKLTAAGYRELSPARYVNGNVELTVNVDSSKKEFRTVMVTERTAGEQPLPAGAPPH